MPNPFKQLYPAEYTDSVFKYDFDKARAEGKKLILFDIDNTFVPHGAGADERSLDLIDSLKRAGFLFCAVSNNDEKRVRMFCDAAGTPFISKAKKPSVKGYLKAVENAGVSAGEAIFFGDQIYTDILGANRAGIHSVLVKPVDKTTDEIQIKFKRLLEKPVLKRVYAQNRFDT